MMTRMRSLLAPALVVVLGLGTGMALRQAQWGAGRDAPAPPAPRPAPPARTRPVSGVLSPALTRELLGGNRDSAVVAAVYARDCLTCEDLGRQIRQLATAVDGGMRVVIATPASDSARVREFMRVERIRHVDLAVYTPPLKLEDGDVIPTPAALVLGRDGRVRRGIAHIDREKNVRTVSFAHELGYLPTPMVPPPDSLSLEKRKGS